MTTVQPAACASGVEHCTTLERSEEEVPVSTATWS